MEVGSSLTWLLFHIVNFAIGLVALVAFIAAAYGISAFMIYRVVPSDMFRTREDSVRIAVASFYLAGAAYVVSMLLSGPTASLSASASMSWDIQAMFGASMPPSVYVAIQAPHVVDAVRGLCMFPAMIAIVVLLFDFVFDPPERRHARYWR